MDGSVCLNMGVHPLMAHGIPPWLIAHVTGFPIADEEKEEPAVSNTELIFKGKDGYLAIEYIQVFSEKKKLGR